MTTSTPATARRAAASSTSDSARDAVAILLRLVARRHVDLHRVSSAICR